METSFLGNSRTDQFSLNENSNQDSVATDQYQEAESEVKGMICLFDLILYIPVNNLSVTSGQVFLGLTSSKLGLMCFAQGHNAVTPVRLEPMALRSQVKNSTIEPLRSLSQV